MKREIALLRSTRCDVCKRSVHHCGIAQELQHPPAGSTAYPAEITVGPVGLLLCATFEHESEPDKYRCKGTLELPL